MQPSHLFHDLHGLLHTVDPAHLGPQSRTCALSLDLLDERLSAAFRDTKLTRAVQDLVRALIYLWHDHLDASHRIVQDLENQDASLIHAIMHRREPDFSNAKYWFRRVGSHPSFLPLAIRAAELLDKHGHGDLHSRLVPNKMWDPFAFVDAVEDADSGKFRSTVEILESIQKIEFECLLENLLNRI